MDDLDGLFIAVAVAALGLAVAVLARIVRDMQIDLELVRMTVPAATGKD